MRAGSGLGVPSSFSPRAATARTRESSSSELVVGEWRPLHEQQRNTAASHGIGLKHFFLLAIDFDDKVTGYRLLVTSYRFVGDRLDYPGPQYTVNSQRSTVNGPWSTVNGQHSPVHD